MTKMLINNINYILAELDNKLTEFERLEIELKDYKKSGITDVKHLANLRNQYDTLDKEIKELRMKSQSLKS